MDEVTIGIVNYNGKDILPRTLDAIKRLEYPNYNVIVIDNLSSDGSVEWIRENYPDVECIALDENIGPAGAKKLLLEMARTRYVVVMDNDIALDPKALGYLMQTMRTVPGAALCHPEIADPDDPWVYHYNGGWMHYLCTFISRPKPDPNATRPAYEIFDVIGGGALLLDRDIAVKVGNFDPDFFFNMEDGDFSARITLAGYRVINVPHAIANHRSKPRGTQKVFYQVRNRWFFMLKLYSPRTLILIAPMLLFFEISQVGIVFLKGAIKDYWRAKRAFLKDFQIVMKKRKAFKPLKQKSDIEWLHAGTIYIPESFLRSSRVALLKNLYCTLLDGYWKIVRSFC